MTSTWWRFKAPTADQVPAARFVYLVVADVLLALYAGISVDSYVQWSRERVAYQADPSCANEAVESYGSPQLPMPSCVVTPGTIVSKTYVTHRRGPTDYYITVRSSEGVYRQVRIAYADDKGWSTLRRGDGVRLQLYRGFVTTIYSEASTMRTANSPVSETFEWGVTIAISAVVLLFFTCLTAVSFYAYSLEARAR